MRGSEESFQVLSPVDGIMMPLDMVPDPVFAQGMLGAGCAITPASGAIRSPISGTVAVAFTTGHAVAIVGHDDVELLVHVGLDTVELNGSAFTARVAAGQTVTAGDPIIDADLLKIEAAGLSTVVPVVVTNSANFHIDMTRPMGSIRAGEPMFTLRRRTGTHASDSDQPTS